MLRIIPVFVLLIALLLFVEAGVGAAPPKMSTSRPLGDMVGLNVKFSQGQPMSDLPELKDLGVRWVRDGVSWADFEPLPGQYPAAFTGDFAKRLAYYKANHIGVVFLLAYQNSNAYPDTPAAPHNSYNAEAYGRYAAAVAVRLQASGVRFVLEIWNEPHNTLAPAFGGTWNGKPPSLWVDQYLKMADAAVTDVKAVDPKIVLLDCDDMWIVHYWFLAKGLPAALDGFAFHPYAALPERAAVDQNTDWIKPFMVVDADASFLSAVRRLREAGRQKLGHTPQMWVTEWGWETGGKSPAGPLTEDTIAAYLARAFILADAAGVQGMCWFSAEDSVDGPMGLESNAGVKRRQYQSFKTLTQQLGAWTLVRQITGQVHQTSGIQAYLFRGPGSFKVAAWSVDGPAGVSLQNTGGKPLQVVDDLGRLLPPVLSKNGRAALTLGPGPLYITGVSANVTVGPTHVTVGPAGVD